jgi:hypothetical protein
VRAFGNTLLSVEDMIGKLGMSDKAVPTLDEASNWSVPDDLIFGCAHMKVKFDIGHKVEVTCGVFFLFHLQSISKNLWR